MFLESEDQWKLESLFLSQGQKQRLSYIVSHLAFLRSFSSYNIKVHIVLLVEPLSGRKASPSPFDFGRQLDSSSASLVNLGKSSHVE